MLIDIHEKFNVESKLDASTHTIPSGSDGSLVQIRSRASDLIHNLFKEIKPANFIEFCTAGEFSMHQLLQYLLTISGPANVYMSTWTIKEDPARVLHALKKSGQIKDLYCVLDYRIRTLDAKHFDFIESIMTRYVLTKCHAKVIAIEGEKASMAVVSSANMSNNPRIEAGYIACNSQSMWFHKGWIMDCINGKKIY
ncbi:MAG: hypothetical protein V4608_03335 [Bacteroidota bacterium]